MRTSYSFLVGFLMTSFLMAQSNMPLSTRDMLNTTENNLVREIYKGFFYGNAPNQNTNIIGNQYFDSTWATCRFVIFKENKVYGNLTGRYDIKNNILEVKSGKDFYSLDALYISSFSLNKAQNGKNLFINTKNFETDETLNGFFELLTDGKLSLVIHHKIEIKKSTYNVSFDVGSKEAEMLQIQKFYYLQSTKVSKFSPNRKEILRVMQDKQIQIENYLRQKQPSLKNKNDLTELFDYYNSL